MAEEQLYIEGQPCYCERMPVQKTFYYSKDAGRRYMACPKGPSQGCGYFEFTDPPLCSRGVEAIHELLKQLNEEKWKNFFEMDKFRKLEAAKVEKLKKKMAATVFVCIGVLCLLLQNDPVVEDEDDAQIY